jgi:hypothetical protein
MTVSAADIWIDTYGDTGISSLDVLSASVYPWTFGNLYIDGGEDLYINYTGSWDDNRARESSQATHYYNITADYVDPGVGTTTKWEEHTVYTYGDTEDSHQMQVTFDNIQIGDHIIVKLLAKVTLGLNSAQDYDESTIYLLQA